MHTGEYPLLSLQSKAQFFWKKFTKQTTVEGRRCRKFNKSFHMPEEVKNAKLLPSPKSEEIVIIETS